MEYEMIREIFNQCSGNQMRDVFIEEIETDNPDAVVQKYLVGKEVTCSKTINDKGQTVFDVVTDGMRQRVSFTQVGA
jgi:D-alanine-D-alanine ligase-like ATP-grasp enzyme